MKKILIYSVKNGNFIDSQYQAIGSGFQEQGYEVSYAYINDPNFIPKIEELLKKDDIDFTLGHNEFGIIHANDSGIFKEFYKSNMHVSILDDAPYNHVTQKTFEAVCPNMLIAYRDRSHRDYLKSMETPHKVLDYFFLPFGSLINERQELSSPKDIDVIFSGMYYGEAERTWHYLSLEKFLVLILDYATDILEREPVTVDNAISKTIRDLKLEITKKDLFPTYQTLYEYAKTYRRNKLIEIMVTNHIKLTVCSDSWKNSRYAQYLNFELAANTKDIFNLYERSKILLQDMAEFNDGSHCRIGDGTLCECLIATENSHFLKKYFTDSDLLFFQWDKIKYLPKLIQTFSKNEHMRHSFINSACEKVYHNFMPKHAALTILEAVSQCRKTNP